jgi:hypothetical protein
MDIFTEAVRAARRGEVRHTIIGSLHDLMMDIGDNVQALLFAHGQEAFIAAVLALGAMDVWSDYLDNGTVTYQDIVRWIDEALGEYAQPGPICVACVRITRCSVCQECGKSVCRACLIDHLEMHGVI